MLTAESADRKVTRNSSHFKKLLADVPNMFRTSQALEGEAIDLDAESSHIPVTVQESTSLPVDPGGSAEILTEPVPRRSTRVSVSPKRLIQEICLWMNIYLNIFEHLFHEHSL